MGIREILASNPCTFCGHVSIGWFQESIKTGSIDRGGGDKVGVYRPGPQFYHCKDHRPEYCRKSDGVNYGTWVQQTERILRKQGLYEIAGKLAHDKNLLLGMYNGNQSPLSVVEKYQA